MNRKSLKTWADDFNDKRCIRGNEVQEARVKVHFQDAWQERKEIKNGNLREKWFEESGDLNTGIWGHLASSVS